MTVTESVALLPALSVAVPLTSVPFVSVLIVLEVVVLPSATQDARPEPPVSSAQLNVTVASALFHPAAFGAGVTEWLMVGAVLSDCGAVDVAVAVLPALSVAVPVTVVPPGTVFEVEAGLVPSATQEAMPEP
ncbi:hypothetical protein [Terrabacter carboxydivorans]|uniref:hypothetical protein n=1 Tax=Terrabacter carboxydivorans TaxID=619730 RepID=UPI0031DB1F9F